ncbi:MAG: hypothetical protein JXA13_01420 [Anaerolineales bacterium]|nr:hypothetical protein [Anaerolineales bacterium]
MSLSVTLTVYLGVWLEALWLWDAASEKYGDQNTSQIKAPGPSRTVMVSGISSISGLILIGLSEWAGKNTLTAAINSFLSNILMGAAMLFILAAGAVGGRLLPRLNEFNIAAVLVVVAADWLLSGDLIQPATIALVIVSTLLLSGALVLPRTPPSPTQKVLYYLVYLAATVFLAVRSGFLQGTGKTDFSLPEAFVFGATFTFFLLYCLFGIRFFLIASSMALPRNRVYAQPIMKKLYRDDQISALPFLLIMTALVAIMIANHSLGWTPSENLSNIAVILCTQLFFRPHKGLEIV